VWRQLEASLQEILVGGGFRLFGGRSRGRLLRAFMDYLSQFARQRLREEIIGSVRHAYVQLAGRLAERARDIGFVRQRLRHLQENLDHNTDDADEEMANTRPGEDYTLSRSPVPSTESFWEAIRQSATSRVVLPDGEEDLERAALRFLHSLRPDQWTQLDKELHERVLAPRGGLHGACMTSGNLTRQLIVPLLEEIGILLSQHLPIMDVTQILSQEIHPPVENNGHSTRVDWTSQINDYLLRAKPLLQAKDEKHQHAFLLVPASPAGKALAETVDQAFPNIKQVRVAGQSDLMLCREQGGLTAADLQKLFQTCRVAYDTASATPGASPHARFDILDWMPLDP
jgi:eukaryotic-like serine/threonine-protein kinase